MVVLLDLSTVGENSRIFLVDVQDSSSHVSRKQVLDVHKCGCNRGFTSVKEPVNIFFVL